MRPYSSKLLMLLRRSRYGGTKGKQAERRLATMNALNLNWQCECKEAEEGEHECPDFELYQSLKAYKEKLTASVC